MPGKTVLFADDSATMRTIMEKAFYAEDVEVVAVPSGEAAIQKAREIIPSVVIADAGMTGVNGYDVCEAIRNESALAGIPVIIMSGISSPYDDVRGKNVRATENIKKPFDTTKLIERVNELCDGDSVSAPVAAPVPAAGMTTPMPPKSSTLHAFPNPSNPGSTTAVPAAPIQASKPHKSTMEFSRPTSVPVMSPEPEPIELTEETGSSDFQVGTLAELAQMDESGGTVQQEDRDDAIELDDSKYTGPGYTSGGAAPLPTSSIAPVKPTAAPSRRPSQFPSAITESVQASSNEAAKSVATAVGLTSEQVAAIQTLTAEVIERVVWEVVPDLAETMIREQIAKLTEE